MPWAFRAIDSDETKSPKSIPKIYQVGPWRLDVRNSAVGEKIVLRSGEHELRRYIAFAEATGYFRNTDANLLSDCIYAKKLKNILKLTEKNSCVSTDASNILDTEQGFGWLCHMVVVRLPETNQAVPELPSHNKLSNDGGCLIYSPVS